MVEFNDAVLAVATAEHSKWSTAPYNPFLSQQDLLKKYLKEFGYSSNKVDNGNPPYWCQIGTNWVKREAAQILLSDTEYARIRPHLPESPGVRHAIQEYKDAGAYTAFSGKQADFDSFKDQLDPGDEVFLGRIGHDRQTAMHSSAKHSGIVNRILPGNAIEVIEFNGVDTGSVALHYYNNMENLPKAARDRAYELIGSFDLQGVKRLFDAHGITYSGGITKTTYFLDDDKNTSRDNNRVILGSGDTNKLFESAARKAGIDLSMTEMKHEATRLASADMDKVRNIPPPGHTPGQPPPSPAMAASRG